MDNPLSFTLVLDSKNLEALRGFCFLAREIERNLPDRRTTL